MLLRIITIATVFLFSQNGTGADEEWTTLTSSRLGLSLQHPLSWEKRAHRPGSMSTFYPTEEDALRAYVTVTAFTYPACSYKWYHGAASVTCRRVYEGTVEDFVAEQRAKVERHNEKSAGRSTHSFDASDFQFSDGSLGKKMTRRKVMKQPEHAEHEMTRVTYCRISDGRLVVLYFPASSKEFEEDQLEKTFDRVARSLRMFPPLSDPPVAGTYKQLQKYGVSFDYPGEWSWDGGGFDDDASIEYRRRLIRLNAPDTNATIRVHFINSSLEAYAKTAPEDWQQSYKGTSAMKISSFENAHDHRGLKFFVEYPMYWTASLVGSQRMYWLHYRVDDVDQIKEERTFTEVRYVLPATDEHIAILEINCRGPLKQFEAMIEHIGKSFEVEELPAERVDPQEKENLDAENTLWNGKH